ncbi:unnamed protein product, partial [Brassica rapa subsp. narinosa]
LLLAHAYLLSSLNSPEHSLVAPLISGSRDYISVDYIQMNHGSSNVGNEIDENALGKMAFYILRSVGLCCHLLFCYKYKITCVGLCCHLLCFFVCVFLFFFSLRLPFN